MSAPTLPTLRDDSNIVGHTTNQVPTKTCYHATAASETKYIKCNSCLEESHSHVAFSQGLF